MTAQVDVVSPSQYRELARRAASSAIGTGNSQVTQLREYLQRTGNL